MSSSNKVAFNGLAGQLLADRFAPRSSASRGTVLLLHGGGQTRHSWRSTGDRLAEAGWTVYALDARGHGDSDWSAEGDYSLDALVGDLRRVVAALDTPPVLVGASMGGITALAATGEGVVSATALVLVDVTPHINPEGAQRIRDFMTARPDGFGSLDEVADAIAAYNPLRPRPQNLEGLKKNVRQHADGRWYWHWDPRFMTLDDEPRRLASTERLAAAARNIDVPTLLVRGTHSDIVTPEGAEELRRLIPHAVLREAAAGHMIAGDDNGVFTANLLDFLAAV